MGGLWEIFPPLNYSRLMGLSVREGIVGEPMINNSYGVYLAFVRRRALSVTSACAARTVLPSTHMQLGAWRA